MDAVLDLEKLSPLPPPLRLFPLVFLEKFMAQINTDEQEKHLEAVLAVA